MKMKLLFSCACFALAASVAQADPTLTIGQPGNAALSTGPSINLGGTFLNFDNLTPNSTFSSYTSGGITISSPDGLEAAPFSAQSAPNELYDTSADGSATMNISLANGVSAIALGIADSDPVDVTIQALGLGGVDLGSPFTFSVVSTGGQSADTYGNGYYEIADSGFQIYGLEITQDGGPDNSGLAIDDLQVAPTPEPASIALLGSGLLGLVILGSFRRSTS